VREKTVDELENPPTVCPVLQVYSTDPWKNTSSSGCVDPSRGGGTPQLRGEQTGKDGTATNSPSEPHFTPPVNVYPGKHVTTASSLNTSFTGVTVPLLTE
jgi:hypothetical protein